MEKKFWKNSHIKAFWGEVAPKDHLVQVYDDEKAFLNTLEGFARTGFLGGESVIIIATKDHIRALDTRLRSHHFDIEQLRKEERYISIDADLWLDQLLVNNWPEENRFSHLVTEVIVRARGYGKQRKIRAFGEIVAVLWSRGHAGATIYLEHLWNQLHNTRNFTLFCAYPKSGFGGSHDAIQAICKTHSKVIDGSLRPATEVYYR